MTRAAYSFTCFLCTVLFYCFCVPVSSADIFDKPEFVHAVRKYYRIVGQSKLPYENELRKERTHAQKRGDVAYFNELDAELKHTLSEIGHNVTEYVPKTKALYNAKLQLKRNIDTLKEGFRKYAETLASELLKAERTDEARAMNGYAEAGEPPIPLGKPGVDVPQPETAKGRQLLKNLLSESEKPQTAKPVEIPVIKKKEDNPFVAKTEIDGEQLQVIRGKYLNIPEARKKIELSSLPGSPCPFGRFTPDGLKFVAVSHKEKTANVFDIRSGKAIAKLNYGEPLGGIDVAPDGKTAVSGTFHDGKLLFWNIENGKILREIKAHEGNVEGIRFGPDGTFVASGSHDKTAAIWDTQTGKERMRFKGHADVIWNVDVSPDGKFLATSSQDGSVRLWNIATGKELHCMKGHKKNDIRALSFSRNGIILASGASDNTIVFWDVKTGKPIRNLIGFEGGITSLGFGPNDSRLAVGCDYYFHSSVWDVETGLPWYRLPCPERGTRTTTFSPDGNTIATCSVDPIAIWSVPTRNNLIQWDRDLKRKRDTAKEIFLKDMPLEFAQVGWHRWSYGTFTSTRKSEEYDNSLWAHASSKYVFRLEGKWKTLKTSYGIAYNTVWRETNCILIVKGDGKELFRSNLVQDKTVYPLELDITGVDRLELIVDPNGAGGGDRIIWFTPTLSR